MKKILFFFISLFCFTQVWADEWTDENGVTWTYTLSNSGTKATITGSSKTEGDLFIPDKMNGINVTYIEYRAFYRQTGLTSVVIPSHVTTIGKQAFKGCTSLVRITLGEKVKTIKEEAFKDCTSLSEMIVLGNVTSVGSGAFSGCFYDGNNDYDWGRSFSVYLLPDGGLSYSYSMKDEDVVEGEGFDCRSLSINIDITDMEKFCNHKNPVIYYIETEEGFCVEADVNLIDSSGNVIKDVVIPEGITNIVDYAFLNCNLTSVTIPSSIEYIGDFAFTGCALWGPINVRITDSVDFLSKEIVNKIYDKGHGLYGIHLVDTEGKEVTDFVVPVGVDALGPSCFRNCKYLTSVTLNEGLKTISENVFTECIGLTSISLPSSITTIGSSAFYGCTALKTVRAYMTTPPSIDASTFPNRANSILYVPKGCLNAYLLADYWTDFNHIIEMDPVSPVKTITLNKVRMELAVGESFTLTATVLPADAANKQLTWTSSDESVATVTNGEVTTVGVGAATITATATDGSGVSASCQITVTSPSVPDTDYTTIDNTIYLEQHEGVAGGQVTLSVRMKNTADIAGYEFNLQLPEGVSVATDSDGFLMAELSEERTTKQKTNSFGAMIQPDGTLKVLCGTMVKNPATGALYTFEGNDGEVARITLDISEKLSAGDYPLYLKNVTVSMPNSTYFETASLKSTFTVNDYLPGDVNGDGRVNVVDFLATANYILGSTPEVFVVNAANVIDDQKEDGSPKINVSDLLGIANLILGSEETAGANRMTMDMEETPRRAAEAIPADIDAMDNVMYVEPVTAAPGTQQTLSIRMKNTSDHIAGYEFLLRLPEGITVATDADGLAMAELSEERTTKRNTDHFLTNLRSDGLKVLCGTLQQDPATGKLYAFSGHDGEVARVTINIPADYAEGEYPVTLVNAVMAGNDESHTTAVSATNIAIRFDTPTGISLTPDTAVTDQESGYYTLDGIKIHGKPTKKGMYIYNGKKEVVK